MGSARTLKLKELAAALGVDAGQLSRETKRAGFPCDIVAGSKLFSVDEVRAWREANIRIRPKPVQAPELESKSEPPKAEPPPKPAPEALTRILGDAATSPIARARAAEQLAAWRVSEAAAGGVLGGREIEALSRAGEELRRAEQDYIAIAREREELIERTIAVQCMGALCMRLVSDLNKVEHALAVQVEIWRGETSFNELSTEKRAGVIREWFQHLANETRELTVKELDGMIAQISKESA